MQNKKKVNKNTKNIIKNAKNNVFYEENLKKELISYIKDEFVRRQNDRRKYEQQWLINANFLMGNQYCGVDRAGEVADYDAQYFWQEHQSFNHLAPIFESRLAKLARVRPSMSVLPSSNEEKDVKSAKVAQNIIKACSHKLGLSEKISRATKWSEICGTSFYKIVWNSRLGEVIGKTDKDEAIYEGDVELIVCPPFEIYPDNSACERLEDCQSIIHARAYQVQALRSMFGVDVEGETLDVFTLDSVGKQSGMGAYSNVPTLLKTTKNDHALVLEYYELPSVEFPNGRLVIVAGDHLIYDGELPFVNAEDGKRTFPFIRQCSIEQSTNFWGTSVIERLIPLQRAYNAVKNRKHEFLNRLTMGVLTVEDGSVDTDDLEEEGISPGKVLVYRQGATPPMMMSYGSIPSGFGDEEDRLYNEMIRISGVGDLNTNLSAFRNMSGTALQLLIDQDEAKLTMTAEQIREAVKNISKNILRLYKQFVSTKRIGRIVGSNSSVEIFYFNSSDLTSEDVVFETQNEMNETTTQRRSMLMELLNNGLLHDENGKLSNRMRAKIVELLGYGIWEQGQELVELHRTRAQKENFNLLDGKDIPKLEDYDDHKVHIDEHTAFLLSNEQDLNTIENQLKKQMMIEHINQHKQALVPVQQNIAE